jgi:hypothetical protein
MPYFLKASLANARLDITSPCVHHEPMVLMRQARLNLTQHSSTNGK